MLLPILKLQVWRCLWEGEAPGRRSRRCGQPGKSAFLKEGSAADANRVGNILSSAYYQSSREVSAELGKIMSEKISSTTGQKNRGLKEAPLVVLDGMYYPACLIEVGFLSNAEEAKKLASSAFQEKIAQAIAQAVDDFSRNPKFKSFLGE